MNFNLKQVAAVLVIILATAQTHAQEFNTLYYSNGQKAIEGKWLITGNTHMTMAELTEFAKAGRPDNMNYAGPQNDLFLKPQLNIQFDGLIQSWYFDGKLLKKANYKNGVLHGNFENYHLNGNLNSKGKYQNGMPDEEWTYYHPNGKVAVEAHYKAYAQKELIDVLNSEQYIKYREFRLQKFSDDRKRRRLEQALIQGFAVHLSKLQGNTRYTGTQVFYTETGDKLAELEFDKDGLRDGKWIFYEGKKKRVQVVYEKDGLIAVYDKEGKDMLKDSGFEDEQDVYRLFSDQDQQPQQQSPTGVVAEQRTEQVFTFVEQMPEFSGGIGKMNDYIKEHIKYPKAAEKDNVEGKVIVKFMVKADGSIEHVEVVKGLREDCNEEAIRVVKSMPRWKPGKQNGTAVNVYYTIPITFSL